MIRRSLNPVLLTALATMSLGVGQQPGPPNDLWPVRRLVDIRAGCHVLSLASNHDPSWYEIVNWLAQCPVLTDIETFWVFDAVYGHGWQLLVTGMTVEPEPLATTIRVPTGTLTYDGAPLAIRDVPDHGYVEVQVELSPEDVEKIQRERETLSAGYTLDDSVYLDTDESTSDIWAVERARGFRQQPIRANYVALKPDGSLEVRELPQTWDAIEALRSQRERGRPDSEIAREPEDMSGFDDAIERLRGIDPIGGRVVQLDPFEATVVKHWPTLAHRLYRADQRSNRKRRAARKRKRGWA
jgi:hypothetical protein